MEQNFQDVSQKSQYNNNSDSFAAHLTQYFRKTSPQKCRTIRPFDIISMKKAIFFMKTWGKSSCTIFTKEIIEIINRFNVGIAH